MSPIGPLIRTGNLEMRIWKNGITETWNYGSMELLELGNMNTPCSIDTVKPTLPHYTVARILKTPLVVARVNIRAGTIINRLRSRF